MGNYFVSIVPPKEIQEKIHEEFDKFRKLVHGKFVSAENIHLTLKFFGKIEEKDISSIKENLRKVSFKKFNCSLDGAGFFRNKFRGVLWAGLIAPEFEELYTLISENSFEENKEFIPHLTVARTKSVLERKEFEAQLELVDFGETNFEVDKFYLMESVLLPEGPRYKIIEEYSLN